jgi:hypothetical protein
LALPERIQRLVRTPSTEAWLALGEAIAGAPAEEVRAWVGPLDAALAAWPDVVREAAFEATDWGPPTAWFADLAGAPELPLRWARVIRASAHATAWPLELPPASLPFAAVAELVCDAHPDSAPDPTKPARLLQLTRGAQSLRCFRRAGPTDHGAAWEGFWAALASREPLGARPAVSMRRVPGPAGAVAAWLATRQPSCRALRFDQCEVDDAAALRLLQGSSLRRLELPNNHLSGEGITALTREEGFLSLEALDLSDNRGLTELMKAIEGLGRPLPLTTLGAAGGGLDLDRLDALRRAGALPRLAELNLRDAGVDAWTAFGWADLGWVADLSALDLRGCTDAAPFVAKVLDARTTERRTTILVDRTVAEALAGDRAPPAGVSLVTDAWSPR